MMLTVRGLIEGAVRPVFPVMAFEGQAGGDLVPSSPDWSTVKFRGDRIFSCMPPQVEVFDGRAARIYRKPIWLEMATKAPRSRVSATLPQAISWWGLVEGAARGLLGQ